jgi:hypothetical protein
VTRGIVERIPFEVLVELVADRCSVVKGEFLGMSRGISSSGRAPPQKSRWSYLPSMRSKRPCGLDRGHWEFLCLVLYLLHQESHKVFRLIVVMAHLEFIPPEGGKCNFLWQHKRHTTVHASCGFGPYCTFKKQGTVKRCVFGAGFVDMRVGMERWSCTSIKRTQDDGKSCRRAWYCRGDHGSLPFCPEVIANGVAMTFNPGSAS